MNNREFRAALGAFTTGVTVITTRASDGEPVGITCNSFNSVSLTPPMVLWSLARTAFSLRVFEAAGHWAVHILSAGQEPLSDRFARRGENKFENVATETGIGNVPLLIGCSSRFQCKSSFKYDGGDHVIFVGEVIAFDHNDLPPLVFQRGNYAVATRKAVALSRTPSAGMEAAFGEDFLGYLLARAHFQFHSRAREHMQAHGLSDIQCFVLFRLIFKDRRSIDELNRMLRLTGEQVTPQLLKTLADRGFVELSQPGTALKCRLTKQGRDVTLRIIAASKAIESDILDRFGYWNAVALKNSLKQLIDQTDPGVPHPWEDLPADRH